MAKVREWFFAYEKELVFGAIIFIAASLSFGMGYLANRELAHAAIFIEKCSGSG